MSQCFALVGRGAAMTVLIWQLYAASGSPWLVSGAMLAAFGVTTLASPWAGHLADRHDRRRVIVAAATVAAVGLAAAAALSVLGLWVATLAVVILAGTPQGALTAAVQGAIPNLVPGDELAGANGTVGAFRSAGFMLGPGIGGALLAVADPAGVYMVAAAVTAAAALLVAGLPGSFRALPHEHGIGGRMDGYRRLWDDRWLRLLTIAWALVMAGIGPVIVAEVVLARQFAVGSVGYGLIAVFWDGGGVAGALLGRRLSQRVERLAVVGGCVAIAGGFAVVGLTPVFWPVLAGMAVAGVFDAFGTVAAQNIIQRRTPDHVRSRVSAALDAVVIGAMAASFALGAPLLALLGAQGVYLASAGTALAGGLLLLPTLGGVPVIPRPAVRRPRVPRPHMRTLRRAIRETRSRAPRVRRRQRQRQER
ncbi:MAG: MFS transporter [Gaiellales bacterium]